MGGLGQAFGTLAGTTADIGRVGSGAWSCRSWYAVTAWSALVATSNSNN